MTLAFNLGIFFRNLEGEPVRLSAKNDHCELQFLGSVSSLSEQVDLTRELNVSLQAPPLRLDMVFEEPEDENARDDDLRVSTTLHRENEAGDTGLILETEFRFGEISLAPLSPPPSPERKTRAQKTG